MNRLNNPPRARVVAVLVGLAVILLMVSGCGLPPDPRPAAPTPIPATLTVSASPPALLLTGSTTLVTARVVDTAGRPIPGARASFTGAITGVLLTSVGGEATAPLLAGQTSSVTVDVDGLGSRTITIPAVPPFRVEVSAAQRAAVVPGAIWHGLLTVTPTTGVMAPPAPTRLMVVCPTQTQTYGGAFGTVPFTCAFVSTGTHVVTAAADTASGWSTSAALTVIADHLPPAAIEMFYALVDSSPSGNSVAFSVRSIAGAARHVWTFGDGETTTTLTPLVLHRYGLPNSERRVTVRVEHEDGRTLATGSLIGLW